MSFYVFHDNRRWLVHTEVGDGFTKVQFDQADEQSAPQQELEPSDEVVHA